ncbi:type IV secretion system DNA-binding domain-containing protein [Actinospica durhamensis]|uniref:Type IV secretion system DNA-binding domain-containing protein n=1 Tax=Actinospica durhamensis TaxID=1508375 RepID=A0A941INX6_9ACTN|nr:FtsK/SpoIIIE domain-containing protein [Actinospica durhamensis]MBR7835905.1 type IV secretion system DNA-binding domain-containing protein [Actinospica durhamensis]
MSPSARAEDSLWSRIGHSVRECAPVARFNEAVLHHRFLTWTSQFIRDLWARLKEICYPVVMVARGTRRGAGRLKRWYTGGSKDRRRIQAILGLALLSGLAVAPYGPVLLALAYLGGAGWLGRDTSHKGADPESAEHIARLQAVYNGLVPYLHDEHDPDQHFKPGGGYRDAFTAWDFDDADRLTSFKVDYSQYVRDGEAEYRAKVERAIEGKVGRSNEFLYDWDEEGNHLHVRVLPPLISGLSCQQWPVAEIEYVLGITDPDSAGRLIPVVLPDEADKPAPAPTTGRGRQLPEGWHTALVAPVIWRVGSPCPNPHLLVVGDHGVGKTNVLRGLLGQALARGQQVAVIDVEQTEGYEDVRGRPGVRGVVEDPARALELLDWVGLECERRAEHKRAELAAVENADTTDIPVIRVPSPDSPGDTAEPDRIEHTDALWLCIDGLPELIDAAARLGRGDIEDMLASLARKARYADVLVLATARTDRVLGLRSALRAQLTVRVAMGSVDSATSTALFGGTLELGGARQLSAGRGYVRVGSGPVIRLQAPYVAPGAIAHTRPVEVVAKVTSAEPPKTATAGASTDSAEVPEVAEVAAEPAAD